MIIVLLQVDLSPESRGKPALKRTTGDFHPIQLEEEYFLSDFHPSTQFNFRKSIYWVIFIHLVKSSIQSIQF